MRKIAKKSSTNGIDHGGVRTTMKAVVVFCMPEFGHFQRLRSIVARLSRFGIPVHVLTSNTFASAVRQAGGRFVDLFSRYPINQADSKSQPVPCRYVAYAAHFAEQISRDVAEIDPGLIIYDTFAVIGMVVGKALNLPYINLCACHNLNPVATAAALANNPRTTISDDCRRAVDSLRTKYDIEASPFLYVTAVSPYLNIYCEPPEFIDADTCRTFEPIEFWGSLPDNPKVYPRSKDHNLVDRMGETKPLRIYISFGTVIWRYFSSQALTALQTISRTLSNSSDVVAMIGLGGVELNPGDRTALQLPRIKVESYVNQWKELGDADVMITHHGLNSTHEAIFNRVAMISYPFFSDQPSLARKCQELGIAIPLTASLLEDVSARHVETAMRRFVDNADMIQARLTSARLLELKTIAQRDRVTDRIISFVGL